MGDNALGRAQTRRALTMKKSVPSLWLTLIAVPALVAASVQVTPQPLAERDFLSRIRRLTVEGRRAGEGYWSPDGKRLVFQSEREPGNPFYQIYVLDMATGDVKRISPGIGKTTCPFFRPASDEILFASTHGDPKSKQLQDEENALRASGKERRYAWDYDPEMDIYVHSEKSGSLKRLTTARGYDAEASYSPDGQWIAFSSMREVYARAAIDAATTKQLETDPSYFADIYIMRADGSGQKRLTSVPGYDGGPFFTHDGSRIVWRRFDERGLIADVWTMKPDGSDAKQITNFRRDELGAVRAPVRGVLPLRVEQAGIRELRGVPRRRGRARKSRCASPTRTGSTACRSPRPTGGNSRGHRAARAGRTVSCSWPNGTMKRRAKPCGTHLCGK